MLRIVRGAGKPQALLRDLDGTAAAIRDYFDAHGYWPDPDLVRSILDRREAFEEHRPWVKEYIDQRDAETRYRHEMVQEGTDQIIDASLQVVGSMLLDQLTQKTKARHDLYLGVRQLEEVRSENQRARRRPHRVPPKPDKPIVLLHVGRVFVGGSPRSAEAVSG